ncbi:MAG: hypothetical protein ACI92N_003269 [Pseudomonadales bacterium]|jgi:hypothetical protein
MHNQVVHRTPKAYRFWFPPLRSGAGYLSVEAVEKPRNRVSV